MLSNCIHLPARHRRYTYIRLSKIGENNQKPNKVAGGKNFDRNLARIELLNLSQNIWPQGSWKPKPKRKNMVYNLCYIMMKNLSNLCKGELYPSMEFSVDLITWLDRYKRCMADYNHNRQQL